MDENELKKYRERKAGVKNLRDAFHRETGENWLLGNGEINPGYLYWLESRQSRILDGTNKILKILENQRI